MIRVPLTPAGTVDVPALNRVLAAERGEEPPASPSVAEIRAWHLERAGIERAIALDHIRKASAHLRAYENIPAMGGHDAGGI